jgi:hypothetical protein
MNDEKARFEACENQKENDLQACEDGNVAAGFQERRQSTSAQGIIGESETDRFWSVNGNPPSRL